jgi:arginine/lysine/ornithine decarboxylase
VLLELERVLLSIPRRAPITAQPPRVLRLEQVLSPREASFLPRETVPVSDSEGRILAAATVGCPPAVPIVVCGERIDRAAVEAFSYYGIKECVVVLDKSIKEMNKT